MLAILASLLVATAVLTFASGPGSAPASADQVHLSGPLVKPAVPPSGTSYLGGWVKPTVTTVPHNQAEVQALPAVNSGLERNLSVLQVYQDWRNVTPNYILQDILAQGGMPMISWRCGTLDRAIVDGHSDKLIDSFALQLKALHAPVFLRWFYEMNFNGPTGQGKVDQDCLGPSLKPAQQYTLYKEAFAHIHDEFERLGATNVAFVWCVATGGSSTYQVQDFYPGGAYVDWIAADGYYRHPTYPSNIDEFATRFGPWYQQFAGYGKPLMVTETATESSPSPAELGTTSQATPAAEVGYQSPEVDSDPVGGPAAPNTTTTILPTSPTGTTPLVAASPTGATPAPATTTTSPTTRPTTTSPTTSGPTPTTSIPAAAPSTLAGLVTASPTTASPTTVSPTTVRSTTTTRPTTRPRPSTTTTTAGGGGGKGHGSTSTTSTTTPGTTKSPKPIDSGVPSQVPYLTDAARDMATTYPLIRGLMYFDAPAGTSVPTPEITHNYPLVGAGLAYFQAMSRSAQYLPPRQPLTASLQVDPSGPRSGQKVRLTAALADSSGGEGDGGGSVTFSADGVALPGCTALPVASHLSCATTGLPVGTAAVTVSYSGDAEYAPTVSAPTDLQVVLGSLPVTPPTVPSGLPAYSIPAYLVTPALGGIGPPTATVGEGSTPPAAAAGTLAAGLPTGPLDGTDIPIADTRPASSPFSAYGPWVIAGFVLAAVLAAYILGGAARDRVRSPRSVPPRREGEQQ